MKQNRIRCTPDGSYVYYKECRGINPATGKSGCKFYSHCLTIQKKENRLIHLKKHFDFFVDMLSIRLGKK